MFYYKIMRGRCVCGGGGGGFEPARSYIQIFHTVQTSCTGRVTPWWFKLSLPFFTCHPAQTAELRNLAAIAVCLLVSSSQIWRQGRSERVENQSTLHVFPLKTLSLKTLSCVLWCQWGRYFLSRKDLAFVSCSPGWSYYMQLFVQKNEKSVILTLENEKLRLKQHRPWMDRRGSLLTYTGTRGWFLKVVLASGRRANKWTRVLRFVSSGFQHIHTRWDRPSIAHVLTPTQTDPDSFVKRVVEVKSRSSDKSHFCQTIACQL